MKILVHIIAFFFDGSNINYSMSKVKFRMGLIKLRGINNTLFIPPCEGGIIQWWVAPTTFAAQSTSSCVLQLLPEWTNKREGLKRISLSPL
jgi:hypothetical protein